MTFDGSGVGVRTKGNGTRTKGIVKSGLYDILIDQ